MVLPESDTGIYVAAGVFTIAVFVVAVAIVAWMQLELATTTIFALSLGFFVFMGVYFVSMAVYRGIEKQERA